MSINPILPNHHHDEEYVKIGTPVGVTDHSELTGLERNDHPQYLLTTAKAADSDKLDGIDSTGFVQRSGNEDISGTKTFNAYPNLPLSILGNPTLSDQAAPKGYVDDLIATGLATKVGKTGNENVGGIKTFTSILVLPGSNPTTDNQAARKKYVDDLITTGLATKVGKTGDENVGGIKTFTSIPVLPASNPTTDNQAVRKKFVDEQDALNVQLAGTQTITGPKTFNATPLAPNNPTADNHLTRKAWVDNQVVAANNYAISLFNDLQAQLNGLKGLYVPSGYQEVIGGNPIAVGTTNYYATNFGVPATASAIAVRLYVAWASSGGQAVTMGEYGYNDVFLVCRPFGHIENTITYGSDATGIIPLGANARFWVKCATLATKETYLYITGYFT